jgi:hypothetical protein
MKKFLAVLVSVAFLVACEKAAVVAPDPVPSPSPSPVAQLYVVVKAQTTQGGQETTGVGANSDFKVSGTATQCFQDGKSVPCPIIPRWHQELVGGFDAGCVPYGSLSSPAVTWNCSEASKSVSIQVSAEDLEGNDLGSDIVVVFIG